MMEKSETSQPARSYDGPTLFREGFRPFFFAAGVWAFAAILIWLPAFQGDLSVPTAFDPVGWHVHEMLFGYLGAVIAGFMLTAVPNWTGRPPLRGVPLAVLFAAWVAGRIAMGVSGLIGGGLAAALDLLFLALLGGVVLREIVAGGNWRNLPMPIAIAGLFAASLLSHLEVLGLLPSGGLGHRLGIGIVVMLISLVGGRVIPSFTGNWLEKRGEARLPAAFAGFDGVCLIIVGLAVAAWVAAPEARAAGAALVLAGLACLIRLARWRGHRTLAEPLVWSLHLGFAWIPVGLVLVGASALWPAVPPAAGLHALTVGAMGSMTLAVMTRASLGHTGQALSADGWTTAVYLLIAAAAASRVAAGFLDAAYLPLLVASSLAWAGAFGLFTLRYGRLLLAR